MKPIIYILAGIAISFAGTAIASSLHPDIEGAGDDGWIGVGTAGSGNDISVKRIFDKDNNVVCWLTQTESTAATGTGQEPSISCVKL